MTSPVNTCTHPQLCDTAAENSDDKFYSCDSDASEDATLDHLATDEQLDKACNSEPIDMPNPSLLSEFDSELPPSAIDPELLQNLNDLDDLDPKTAQALYAILNDSSEADEALMLETFAVLDEDTMPLIPLLSQSFNTSSEALQYCWDWAKRHWYTVIIKNSAKMCGKPCIYVSCDCGGQWREGTVLGPYWKCRRTGSCKSSCPFRLKISEKEVGWLVEMLNPKHNHEDMYNSSHTQYHHQITHQHENMIKNHLISGLTAVQSLSVLQQETGDVADLVLHNIYN